MSKNYCYYKTSASLEFTFYSYEPVKHTQEAFSSFQCKTRNSHKFNAILLDGVGMSTFRNMALGQF